MRRCVVSARPGDPRLGGVSARARCCTTRHFAFGFFRFGNGGVDDGGGDAARASERMRRGFARLRGISTVVSGSYRDAMRSKGLASSPEAPSPFACNDALFPSRVFCPLVGSKRA
uniref:Uncharacterized protein n=1 Tax=Micromonas pusilla TaxID=38833 RepID=A0A7S0KQS4_MICPS